MKTITEYTKITETGISVISKEEACSNKNANIYYLKGVRADLDYSKGGRAKDKDILIKDMFVLDLDIRNNCDVEITDEEIIDMGNDLADFLTVDGDLFGEFSDIIFTGNGLHIYYSGVAKYFTPSEYSNGVDYIYKEWDKFIGGGILKCDRACKNIARILRLPGTVNQKNGAKTVLLSEKNIVSSLFENIKLYNRNSLASEKNKIRNENNINEIKYKHYEGKTDNTYKNINEIPAYIIMQLILPQFKFNGRRNFNNNKGGYTGFFYSESTNSIVNGGSRHIPGLVNSRYNNFALVKHIYSLSNSETFQYFTDRFMK